MSLLLVTVLAVPVKEPQRPSNEEVLAELTLHVQALAGPDAVPRPEQIAAVQAVVAQRRRTLLVARTGFGKSAVYFSATRMLRDRGWGPTIVVSPLLALMRDQVAAAHRLGINAVTINSSNIDSWAKIEEQINNDEIDLLLIAPERLANNGFRRRVFDTLQSRSFALVCDEAHCISDWGHDFRPDYRRLRQLLNELPAWTPVLATTATANQRVTNDIAKQLGSESLVLRTSLDRESLRLTVVDLPSDSHRLAWLAEQLPNLVGSGIIYCLTVQQAQTTAAWLRDQGHDVHAYTGAVDTDTRVGLEDGLRSNNLKALVATSALGMGFDKGDLAFVVHLGLPPSPVAYYQQIGRAGRSLQEAEVIALPRPDEDAAVWRWFESVSMPSEEICRSLLEQLDLEIPTSIASLETAVNLGRSRLGTLLNILEVDGAIDRAQGGWVLRAATSSGEAWAYDHALISSLKEQRRAESNQMRDWAALPTCRLSYLREALDDDDASDCGRCDICQGNQWQMEPEPGLVMRAQDHLRGGEIIIDQRKQWPTGLSAPKGRIKPARQNHPGRALARYGDGGWHRTIEQLLETSLNSTNVALPPDLIAALASVLKRWDWSERPTWICTVPSRRHHGLVQAMAQSLGTLGKLPVFSPLLQRDAVSSAGFQSDQANSAHQVSGVWQRFYIDDAALPPSEYLDGPVLLVDDQVDSRWTLTTAGYLLSEYQRGAILPLALRAR